METHIGADRLCHGAVVFMRLRYNAFAISETVAHSMGHGAVLGKVPDYGAIFAPTASLTRDFGLLLHRERLRPRCY